MAKKKFVSIMFTFYWRKFAIPLELYSKHIFFLQIYYEKHILMKRNVWLSRWHSNLKTNSLPLHVTCEHVLYIPI